MVYFEYANPMQIRNLKVYEYRGQKVYVRNFASVFEYLIPIKGEIFHSHIKVNRTPLQFLLGKDFSEKQLKDIIAYLMKMAESTIDYNLDTPTETV